MFSVKGIFVSHDPTLFYVVDGIRTVLTVIEDITFRIPVTAAKLFKTFDAAVNAENMILFLHELCVLSLHF